MRASALLLLAACAWLCGGQTTGLVPGLRLELYKYYMYSALEELPELEGRVADLVTTASRVEQLPRGPGEA